MPVKNTPHVAGPPPQRTASLDQLAHQVVQSGAAPCAACASGFRADDGWHWGVGCAGTLWPKFEYPTDPDTIFDLASLTKPVFAVAAATESTRSLDWHAPLCAYLPELRGTWAASATLEQLLSHRSGLLPHRELFSANRSGVATSPHRMLSAAAKATGTSMQLPASVTTAVYSDLGYLLAGAAIERFLAKPLDRWLADVLPALTHQNLGSVRHWLSIDERFRARCAPTEVVGWRGGLVWSQVHDENAWTLAGHGLCGHAGLFGTVLGVARFGAAVLDGLAGRPSSIPHNAACLTTQERAGGSLCAGFDRKSDVGSTAGTSASANAFGHLGFTGTSLWCDPDRSLVVVLLTNRVCPSRNNVLLRAMRAPLHEALFQWGAQQKAAWPA